MHLIMGAVRIYRQALTDDQIQDLGASAPRLNLNLDLDLNLNLNLPRAAGHGSLTQAAVRQLIKS